MNPLLPIIELVIIGNNELEPTGIITVIIDNNGTVIISHRNNRL